MRASDYNEGMKSAVEITPDLLRQVADTVNIIKCGPRELAKMKFMKF